MTSVKRRRKLIIPENSSSEQVEQVKPVEASSVKKPIKKEMKFSFIANTIVNRPHTRPTNKLILKHKLVSNPWLKDLVINLDGSP